MREQSEEEESEVYKYYLEVADNGKLYAVTEYETLITTWEVNCSIKIDEEIYFISVYESE